MSELKPIREYEEKVPPDETFCEVSPEVLRHREVQLRSAAETRERELRSLQRELEDVRAALRLSKDAPDTAVLRAAGNDREYFYATREGDTLTDVWVGFCPRGEDLERGVPYANVAVEVSMMKPGCMLRTIEDFLELNPDLDDEGEAAARFTWHLLDRNPYSGVRIADPDGDWKGRYSAFVGPFVGPFGGVPKFAVYRTLPGGEQELLTPEALEELRESV